MRGGGQLGEEPTGELRVRADAMHAERMLAWAAAWPDLTAVQLVASQVS